MEASERGQIRICAIYARVSTDHQRAQGTIARARDVLDGG